MSIAAVAWAKRQDTKTSGAKLVLMVVADYATFTEFQEPTISEGRHYAWPGVATLAADCLMSERTVITHLAALEALDLLRREQRRDRDGRRTSDFLVLPVDNAGDKPWTTDQTGAYVDQVQNLHVKDAPTSGATFADRSTSSRTTKEPPKEPKRGTRIPDDFEPDESMRLWYRDNIGAAVNGVLEHEKFMDYWRSRSGQIAVKKDWVAAWRNWMRSALERASRDYRTAGPPKQAPRFPTAAERSQAQRDEWAERAKAAEAWVEQNGGDPNDVKLVLSVMERMKGGSLNGSATRTPGMYSGEGDVIDGTVVPPKEVTAGEDS